MLRILSMKNVYLNFQCELQAPSTTNWHHFDANTTITIVYMYIKSGTDLKGNVKFNLFCSIVCLDPQRSLWVLMTLWPGGWCQICFHLVNINTVSWRKFWCLIGLAAEYIYLPRQRQRRLHWKIAFLLSGQIHVELGK